MPRSRAERRHHHNRMLEKAKNFGILTWKKDSISEEEYHKHLAKVAETKTPCSCHMCRNPRHSDFYKGDQKLTMQERRFKESGEYDE